MKRLGWALVCRLHSRNCRTARSVACPARVSARSLLPGTCSRPRFVCPPASLREHGRPVGARCKMRTSNTRQEGVSARTAGGREAPVVAAGSVGGREAPVAGVGSVGGREAHVTGAGSVGAV